MIKKHKWCRTAQWESKEKNLVKVELKPQVEDEQEMRRQNAKDREFTHSFLRY